MKKLKSVKGPTKLEVTNRRQKSIPNAQEIYPASRNLLKSLRWFYNVILQHQTLPRLAYFQSTSSGQNKIVTFEVAKNPLLRQNCN